MQSMKAWVLSWLAMLLMLEFLIEAKVDILYN